MDDSFAPESVSQATESWFQPYACYQTVALIVSTAGASGFRPILFAFPIP
jgi:hypothetical protein